MTVTTPTWHDFLTEEKKKPYFAKILEFVNQERQTKTIYPPNEQIFNALTMTPYADLKVVIIGQDPYHGPSQAHGLSFSVPQGTRPPPSLINIFKELHQDLGIKASDHGCLDHWAQQGVLLLNSVLTVEASKPQSHAKIGWQQFTDTIIQHLNQHSEPLAFLLWGAYAQRKAEQINNPNHLILKAPHPSPLSAHRGYFGCKHFSRCNEWLTQQGRQTIDWQLPTATPSQP